MASKYFVNLKGMLIKLDSTSVTRTLVDND